jgi:predicted transport protein
MLFSDNNQKDFDTFMRHYLLLKTHQTLRIDQIYSRFKDFVLSKDDGTDSEHRKIVAEIYTYASYYCNMAYGKEQDTRLRNAFNDLMAYRVEPAFPLLLEMYDDFQKGIILASDFEHCVRIIESYVYRRYICNLPNSSLDKTFLTFSNYLNKKDYVHSFQLVLASFESYKRFPDDGEFYKGLQLKEIYSSNQITKCNYTLRKLERYGWKEHVNLENLTIEHVMPQTLNKDWQSYLGVDWELTYKTWLNRLGNLTLTGYNSEYQNYSFLTKRTMQGGYLDSSVHLNQSLAKETDWTENTMVMRAKTLAEKALQVWQGLSISTEETETYRKSLNTTISYSFKNYTGFEEGGISRSLFNSLVAVLSDTAIVCLKYYIALKYKNINLITIAPSELTLKCWLSLNYTELENKTGFKDVKETGHWGTGYIEFIVKDPIDLSTLLPAIEQARIKIDNQPIESSELSQYKLWQKDYWTAFRNYCLEHNFKMNPNSVLRSGGPYHDYKFSTEIPYIASWLNKNNDKTTLSCGLVFYPKAHDKFETVLRHKKELEEILGYNSEYREFPKSEYFSVTTHATGNLTDSDNQKEFQWFLETMEKIKIVLEKLKSGEWA